MRTLYATDSSKTGKEREAKMESRERAHIAHVLLLPYPAQGHINPVLQFGKQLVWRGLRVTLALTRSVSSKASRSVLASSGIRLVEISDGHDAGGFASAASIEAYLNRFRVVGSATLGEAVDRLAAEWAAVDCVAYDASLSWAVDVAHQRKVRIAALFTQCCTVCALYNEVHRRDSPAEVSLPIAIDGVPLLGPADAPSFLVAVGPYEAFLRLLLRQFSNLDRVDVVLFNTFHELEPEVAKTLGKLWPTKTIGPCIPSMYLNKRVEGDAQYGLDLIEEPNRHCIFNWLNLKPMRSVIYVTFGSVAKLSKDQIEELAWGLQNTGKHFLWVVGPTGMDSLPHDFNRSNESDKELVVNWCPQLDVLAHPAVGCFVTHCGWNSTLEALSLGVPMVGMPLWSDQPTSAWLIEKQWGVGVRAKADEKGVVRSGEIELRIKEVMEGERGEEIRRNAKKYKEMVIEATSEDGSSDKGIKEFIALIAGR